MYLLQIQHAYEYFPSHVITCHVCSSRHHAYSFPLLHCPYACTTAFRAYLSPALFRRGVIYQVRPCMPLLKIRLCYKRRKELRHLYLGLLMGQNYVLSLHVKCPKVGTMCNLIQGKFYVICLKGGIPEIQQRIGYESHLDSLQSHQWGTPGITLHLT